MNPWFRFYVEVLDDPKVQKLPPHLFKTWVNILCLASVHDGVLPPVDDISFRLRISTHDVQQQIDEMIGLGLLDIRRDKRLEPHNWMKRQFASDRSTDRVRKWRKEKAEKPCNADETLHETAPEQNRTDSDTETDTDSEPPKPPCEGGSAADHFFKSRRTRRRDLNAAWEAAFERAEAEQ